MHAEIIAIGSELTSGAKLDTNSQWLSCELATVGIPVRYHVTVADEVDEMLALLRDSVRRADVVLMTGGLGPTLDDVTRHLLASLVDKPLVLHEPSLEHIRGMFARRNRVMPVRNEIQAMFPEGSEPLPNPRGTAPGIWMEVARDGDRPPCRIAAMPGVPSEMKRMFHETVLSRLSGTANVIRRARINVFGLGESHAEEMLGELTQRGHDPDVGITVHEATITLRINAQGSTADECAQKIATARAEIQQRIGHYVFGEEDEELEHVVVAMLRQRGLTLATAESGTGGLLAHRLTGVDDFEKSYLGGVVVPTSEAKCKLLDVNASVLESAGPVSEEVARKMAIGCRQCFHSDFALAITECPAFDADDPSAAVPKAYIAFAHQDGVDVDEHVLLGDPGITKSRAAKTALNMLRLRLLRESQGANDKRLE